MYIRQAISASAYIACLDSIVYMCADLMSIMLWMTPAGTLDEGGVPQPAYLNFRQRLLHEPADADSFKARKRLLCSLPVLLSYPGVTCQKYASKALPRMKHVRMYAWNALSVLDFAVVVAAVRTSSCEPAECADKTTPFLRKL